MKKYWRILTTLIRCKISRQMFYRLSFWTAFWVDLLVFAMQLITFSAIFSHVESIGGWGLPQMAIFLGTFTMLDAVYMSTYFFGVLAIPEKIRTGGLDLYLVKPVNPLFLLTVEGVDFGTIVLTIPGLMMVVWGMARLGIRLTPVLVVGYLLLFVMMYLLMYAVMVVIRTAAFWLVRTQAFNDLENALVEFSFRIPGVVYQGVWKVILYVLLPYGIMATLPTQFLTGGMAWYHWLLAGGVLAAFLSLMSLLWQAGLRHYNSASS